jgi:Cdc6-like AAA superfamily ATPase
MADNEYYKHYEKHGFFFDRAVLTTYCLSLYTKPFVILSGISGTGKTKIAQLFTDYATQVALKSMLPLNTASSVSLPGKWILMTVTDAVISGDGRANFKYSDIDALLSAEEISALVPKIEELRKAGRDDNICDPFPITIEGLSGEIITAKVYLQRASSPLLRVRFKSKRGEPEYDSTTYFKKYHKRNEILKLEKVGDKRLRIVSVNDKAVIQKSNEIEQKENLQIKNTCFISVRSDWTDSSPLLGYYNLVEQKYHVPAFLSFLMKAIENPKVPFFLILDEMNLAKVEYYFSDFLSCIESRYISDNNILQEKIRLHAGSSWIESDDDYFDLIPTEIEIPQNLFVTGTVNVDESTYMFSPKVLDRANVIEFNNVNLTNYESPGSYMGDHEFELREFPNFNLYDLPNNTNYKDLPSEAKGFLSEIHSILEKHNMHFGYRVINEISKYINNASKYCEKKNNLLEATLDYQVIQKVFPKLNGPHGKLDLPLRELLKFLSGHPNTIDNLDLEAISKIIPEDTKYPLSVAKLQRMYTNLTINGFTNFIE